MSRRNGGGETIEGLSDQQIRQLARGKKKKRKGKRNGAARKYARRKSLV